MRVESSNLKKLIADDCKNIWEICGFCMAGVFGFLIDYGILFAGISIGLGPFMPRFISVPVAIMGTFLLNRFVTFRNFSIVRPREIVSYYLAMWLGVIVNLLTYSILVWLHINHLASLVTATFFAAVLNFFSSRSVLRDDSNQH
jgi:putative flippase GtrA